MKKTLLALSTVALLATGCSSTNDAVTKADIEALRSDIASANSNAQKAYQAAQQANMNAQDAKATAMKTEEKLNRVFRKAQMK